MNYTKYKSVIISHLSANKYASIVELAKICQLTKPTIRRYLRLLEQDNIVKCTYGGAEFLFPLHFSALELRMNDYSEDKKAIAQKACELVNDGENIFLGGGSSIAHMAHYLSNKKELVIITNSLYIINELSFSSNIRLICTGGVLYPNNNSFSGDFTTYALTHCIIDKAFLGVASFSPQFGISYRPSTVFDEETHNESLILSRSKKNIFLADASKFSKKGSVVITEPHQIDTVITNKKIMPEELKIYETNKIELIMV